MKHMRYEDMPPELRAQFDKARFKWWVDSGGKFDVDSTGDMATVTYDDKVIKIPRDELPSLLAGPTPEQEIKWQIFDAIREIGHAMRARHPSGERWARWHLLVLRAALLRLKADRLIEQADELLDVENEIRRIDGVS